MSEKSLLSWAQDMSLRNRIFVWFFGLLLTVQAVTAWVVYRFSLDNVERQIHERLMNGQDLFVNEFKNRSSYLQNGVITIGKDWALRQAMGQQDRETLKSALDNHRLRIDADLGFAIDTAGQLLGSTQPMAPHIGEQLIQDLQQHANSGAPVHERIVAVGEQLYQLEITPVKAPVTIGWVAIGFAIDDQLARHFANTADLEISFVYVSADTMLNQGKVVGSTLPHHDLEKLELSATEVEKIPDSPRYQESNSDIIQLGTLIRKDSRGYLLAVMQKSVQEFLEEFQRWWINLLLFYAFALVSAGLVAAMIARSVTRPVSSLLHLTQRITSGNFSGDHHNGTESHSDRRDEIGALAREFHTMQLAVSTREEEIRYRAEHDALTGLYNRDRFLKDLQQNIDQRCSSELHGEGVLAVVLFNINRFKDVNDTLGHHNGDHLLQRISQRLTENFPDHTLARVGADQFGLFVALPNYQGIHDTCRRIKECFVTPFCHNDIDMLMSVTQGVATFPEHGQDALTLLRLADVAMFSAKNRRQEMTIYDSQFDHHSVQRLSLMSDLPRAIEQDQLALYYQPTLRLDKDGEPQLAKVECLVRWIHPNYGFVPPDDFIHLAEQSGTIIQLTQWVLKTALAQCHEWRQQGKEIGVAVNISASDLFRGSLLTQVPELLETYQIPRHLLTIEVTESEVMEDPDKAVAILQQLRDLGIRLSVDDYGTGYSSLAHLKQLPVQELKIDKSFVLNLRQDQDDQAIVRSTIDLGHTMGLVIVAEGVEDADSLDYLQSHGCDYAQGYHMSRPLSQADMQKWLAETDYSIKSTGDVIKSAVDADTSNGSTIQSPEA